MRRLRRDESGFTMATTVWVLSIVVLFSAVAIAVALRGLDDSQRARDVERAQAAADAGLDIAGYRMNKTLVSPTTAKLLGTGGWTHALLRTAGCTGISMGTGTSPSIDAGGQTGATAVTAGPPGGMQIQLIPSSANFCQMTVDETLEDGSRYRYAISTRVNLPSSLSTLVSTPLGSLIVRHVVAIGRSGGEQRRAISTYWLDVTQPTQLFVRRRYVRCPPEPTDANDPFSGCPQNPGY